ncbi:hypothetical protein FRX31_004703 [Thalictrum thalictroides]|uniref:Uncharacterized protein n=1 Tax=Thalictrum thalictroides TaxID=46969 RepID=A0A7J6X7F9_THATH|nr:hypothetical protein FRX31_004703 [Thalictrum thalictroides]
MVKDAICSTNELNHFTYTTQRKSEIIAKRKTIKANQLKFFEDITNQLRIVVEEVRTVVEKEVVVEDTRAAPNSGVDKEDVVEDSTIAEANSGVDKEDVVEDTRAAPNCGVNKDDVVEDSTLAAANSGVDKEDVIESTLVPSSSRVDKQNGHGQDAKEDEDEENGQD